jgi:hypothetical protein
VVYANTKDVRHQPKKANKVDFKYEEVEVIKPLRKKSKIKVFDHTDRYFTERPSAIELQK